MMICMKRGNEWCSIQDIDNESCLWLYGEGVEGNGRSVSPISVKDSQIQAHMTKGWVIV